MSATADPALDGWTARTLPGFFGLVGPLWTRREANGWAYALLAEGRHTNPAGLVHGGMLSTLADHALSTIAWAANERKPCITIALDVRFFSPARPGDLIVARGEVVRQTAALAFMQGTLSVGNAPIATASAILRINVPLGPAA